MKLDLIVYGRGQERSEGFQHFARPPYWTDEMLITMSRFNEMWTGGDLRETCPQAFAAEENPWGKTYMFICQPPPYCCALLRCTRAEGDEPGKWLKEVRNYDIWSMEGLCCPYEERESFFALLPSMILWLGQDNSSFYGRLRRGAIGQYAEIPEELIYNPYARSGDIPDAVYEMIPDRSAFAAWSDLWTAVRCAPHPFHFLYGPLADHFGEVIGEHYGVREIFSTVWRIPRDLSDPFEKILPIEERDVSRNVSTYRLRLKLAPHKNGGFVRQWGIYDITRPDPDEDILKSSATVGENGFDLIGLTAEAEAIRSFARQLNWTVAEQESTEEQYTFKKED